MRFPGRLAATLSLALLAVPALSADPKVDVTVSHVGTDGAGRRLAAALRYELGLSKRMRLVTSSNDRVGVYLVTMAGENGTIYSATWTLGGIIDDGYWSPLNRKTLDIPDRFPLVATVGGLAGGRLPQAA